MAEQLSVPFLDLNRQNQAVAKELQQAFARTVADSAFILGPAVEEFERDFAQATGTAHCVGLNSGTSALHLALVACDIGPGDEVITTPHSWISTAWAVSYVGATPVFVDVTEKTWTIDPAAVEAAINPKTKAIVGVDLYGRLADWEALEQLADEHGLSLIEDAAQAHGAARGGRRAGAFGRAGCFSFYPSKNLGALGEAGAVVTDDERLAERIRRLRDHSQQGRHHHVEIGYNARMDGIQAAALSVKLPFLDEWNRARRRHAEAYCEQLGNIEAIDLPSMPETPESHVWHLNVVCLNAISREDFREKLRARGVATGVHYPTPIPYQPAYRRLGYEPGAFPVAEDCMRRCVSLPMFPEMTDAERQHVVAAIREIC